MVEQIVFDKVTIRLKDRILYQDLDFAIHSGDRYIFLGPNGIGKSLLLELISLGYTRNLSERYKGLQISGRILDAQGNDLLDPATRRKIAYVTQDENFYKGKTVKEICISACNGIGTGFNEDKFDRLLKAFSIYEKKNLKIKNNVSFGEGKIVHIISRILKLEVANILLLDEPLNHLSFRNSKVFNDLLVNEVRNRPELTIIMVSHCRAMNFTDQAMVYNAGTKGIDFKPYHSFDCFAADEQGDCCT